MPRDKQQLLIETSLQLFNRHGFHATGIDTIMAVSGVSKTTLYKYFRSKELLILAVLEYRHQNLVELFDSTIKASREAHPQEKDSYHLHAFSMRFRNGLKKTTSSAATSLMPVPNLPTKITRCTSSPAGISTGCGTVWKNYWVTPDLPIRSCC